MMKGLDSYKKGTESLYNRDEESGLVNFGIPVRFNNETSKSIKSVRRCIQELNQWMESELARSKDLSNWAFALQQIFPNLKITSMDQSLKLYKHPPNPSYCWKIKWKRFPSQINFRTQADCLSSWELFRQRMKRNKNTKTIYNLCAIDCSLWFLWFRMEPRASRKFVFSFFSSEKNESISSEDVDPDSSFTLLPIHTHIQSRRST